MPEKLKTVLTLLNFAAVLGILAVLLLKNGTAPAGTGASPAQRQDFAAELVNKGLYKEAAAEYEALLNAGITDPERRANTMYLAADLYMEKLRDYETALIWYLRLKNYHPGSPLVSGANKKIVACLEHLGRSLDARLALQDASALEKNPEPAGTIIATVGSRKVTDSELRREMEKLPPQMKKMVETREGRLNFLRQYIARDLVYNAARRMGLQDDADIVRQVADIRRELMVQAFLKKEAGTGREPDAGAVKMYYQAHRDRYTDPQTGRPLDFDACRQQAAADCVRDREQEAYGAMMERMLQAEDVMIYDDLVK